MSAPKKRVMWIVYFPAAETDVFLEKTDDGKVKVITGIHGSDASWTQEYFGPIASHFGIEVKRLAVRSHEPDVWDTATSYLINQGLGYLLDGENDDSDFIRSENDG